MPISAGSAVETDGFFPRDTVAPKRQWKQRCTGSCVGTGDMPVEGK